ncbi:MAG TPA: SDR family NAD(P)-dependent oxidoreductase [Geminicoccaceae bacterium]|nr:SDR family NAD(P)-dependent oxidoreductase [Geminicoccaceae bacterium]
MGRLEGKVALITGGGGGIGRAAAQLFAREGAKVVIAEVGREAGEASAAAIREKGGEALFVATDVSRPEQVEAAVRAAVDAYGGLHVLYNNAGGATSKDGKVTEMDLDEFWRTIGVDLFGTFLGCRFAIPVMVEGGGGSIINTTSIRAMIGTAGADAYTSAKGGVRALTQALALQWAAHGIRVNAIAPGVILTERVRKLLREDDPIYRKSLLGASEPEDVAHMALYLASDESRRVTGAILPMDSGASAI